MSRVLVVEEDPQLQKMLTLMLQREGHEVAICSDGHTALERCSDEAPELVILDYVLPDCSASLVRSLREKIGRVPFIVAVGGANVPLAVELMRSGADDILTKPFSGPDLMSAVSRAVGSGVTKSPAHQAIEPLRKRAIITRDPLMIRILEIAESVARSDATVLIQGESGTGKELMARLLHDSSPRRNEPFVAVNCAALPGSLLESELFGHEKGAFTGAHARKIGKFELAHRGTILLDEVSEMELLLQAKLLRVLQEREVDRVGGKDPVAVDVRVLATTNRKLEDMVRSGGFRADLYYRLNVIPLTLPSLRQRPSDIPVLAEYFMKQILGKQAPALTPDVVEMLQAATWPGNIRELRNAVERAAILSHGGIPRQEDFLMDMISIEQRFSGADEKVTVLPRTGENDSRASVNVFTPHSADHLLIRAGMTVHDVEKSLILETLRSTSNNRTQAAQLLGISVRTLRNKLAEYRLPSEFEGDDAIDEASSG